jgi:hypothetical protein
MPEPMKDWSMTTRKENLIKSGAKVVSHARYVTFQMAEVAIPRNLLASILRTIAELRPPPPVAPGTRGLFVCLALEPNLREKCVVMTGNATFSGAGRSDGPPRYPIDEAVW